MQDQKYFSQMIISGVPEEPAPKIVFHVKLTSDESILANKIITFRNISLDTANAYNAGDGVFRVPETGIYVFTWTITVDSATAQTELMINTGRSLRTVADSEEADDYHTSTGIVVASVKEGDHVYVKFSTYLASSGTIDTDRGQCTFSGWKLD